jgi:hypothetical protein
MPSNIKGNAVEEELPQQDQQPSQGETGTSNLNPNDTEDQQILMASTNDSVEERSTEPHNPQQPEANIWDEQHRRLPMQIQLEIEALMPRENSSEQKEDSLLWGDMMVMGKKHCRIVFNNVQGLVTANNGIENSEIGKEVMANKVTILGMSETNRNWRNKRFANDVKRRF